MALSMIFWGGSWISGKVITRMAEPEIIIFWRYLISVISFIFLIPFLKNDFKVNKRALVGTAFCGILMIAYSQLFFTGLRSGLASSGGVIVTTLSPIITFLISSILFSLKLSYRQIAGLGIGLLSGMFFIEVWNTSYEKLFSSGNLFFVGGALLWSFITVLSQKVQKHISPIGYNFYMSIFTVVFQFPFCGQSQIFSVFSYGIVFWANLLFLAILSSTFAGTMFFLAARRVGAGLASSFMFIVPASALFLGIVILGESPTIFTLIGGSAAIISVYLINRKKN